MYSDTWTEIVQFKVEKFRAGYKIQKSDFPDYDFSKGVDLGEYFGTSLIIDSKGESFLEIENTVLEKTAIVFTPRIFIHESENDISFMSQQIEDIGDDAFQDSLSLMWKDFQKMQKKLEYKRSGAKYSAMRNENIKWTLFYTKWQCHSSRDYYGDYDAYEEYIGCVDSPFLQKEK
ncbi:MAG: hypothetical protein ACW987_00610 [Candidatus Thorarchaeota archaeon]|jgi:hypothetical protein